MGMNVPNASFSLNGGGGITLITYEFCFKLEDHLQKVGVKFKYNSKVSEFVTEGTKIKGIKLENGEFITADTFVVCGGIDTRAILQKLRVYVPLYPIKGYTVQFKDHTPLDLVVYFPQKRIYFAKIKKDTIRASAFADIYGNDWSIDPKRSDLLKAEIKSFFPHVKESDMDVWTGLRPVSADDVPIVSKVRKYDNLFTNCGHGARGTMLSFSTGKLLSEIITNQKGFVNINDYSLDRFFN